MSNRNLLWTWLLVGRFACFVLGGHGGGYGGAESYSSASGSAVASSLSSPGCMTCLCRAATGCDVNKQCVGDVCGAFAISWQYWKDAGEPGGDYVSCANDPSCALNCVQSYVTKYAQDCDGNGIVDCADAARLHRLGRAGCTGWLDTEFASRLSSCDAATAQGITSILAQAKRTPNYAPATPANYQNEDGTYTASGSSCSTCSGSRYGSNSGSGVGYAGTSGGGYVGSSGFNYVGSSGSNGYRGYSGPSNVGSSESNYVSNSGSNGYRGSSGQGYVGTSGSNSNEGSSRPNPSYVGSSGGYAGNSGVSSYTSNYNPSYSRRGSLYGSKYGQSANPSSQGPPHSVSTGSTSSASASASSSALSTSGYSGTGHGTTGTGFLAGGSGFDAGGGYGSSARNYAGGVTAVSDYCLSCICNAATGCSLSAGCNHAGCGPLRISQAYWIDAGSPGGDYQGCTNDLRCSMGCAKNYLTKYAKDCNDDGIVQCGDYARIHRLGPHACHGELDWEFQSRINTCPA